jgi:hypothetical protein
MLINILCLRTEYFLHILSFVFWDGLAPLKNTNFRGEGRCLAWSKQGAYRNSLYTPCMSPVRSLTSYQGRSTQDPFPSQGHSTPVTRWPCSERESHVGGALSSRIWETNSRRGINMKQIVGELWFVIVGIPGGASVEELLSQLPEDVIRSGLNKEDPGSAPSLLHSIYR